MEKGKCMLKLWWKIIYLAALGTLILNTYTMVHMDSSQRRLWKSKIRMIEKIEQEHPQDVGTVEVWDGEKKRVYYGLVTIGNDGSNGERVRVMLDGVLRSEEQCELKDGTYDKGCAHCLGICRRGGMCRSESGGIPAGKV